MVDIKDAKSSGESTTLMMEVEAHVGLTKNQIRLEYVRIINA